MPAYHPPAGRDRYTDAPPRPAPAWSLSWGLTPPAGSLPGAPSSGLGLCQGLGISPWPHSSGHCWGASRPPTVPGSRPQAPSSNTLILFTSPPPLAPQAQPWESPLPLPPPLTQPLKPRQLTCPLLALVQLPPGPFILAAKSYLMHTPDRPLFCFKAHHSSPVPFRSNPSSPLSPCPTQLSPPPTQLFTGTIHPPSLELRCGHFSKPCPLAVPCVPLLTSPRQAPYPPGLGWQRLPQPRLHPNQWQMLATLACSESTAPHMASLGLGQGQTLPPAQQGFAEWDPWPRSGCMLGQSITVRYRDHWCHVGSPGPGS